MLFAAFLELESSILLAMCSILELKLPFCMIFAYICNVLELKYFIWHAIYPEVFLKKFSAASLACYL